MTFIRRNIQKENYFVEMAWRSIFFYSVSKSVKKISQCFLNLQFIHVSFVFFSCNRVVATPFICYKEPFDLRLKSTVHFEKLNVSWKEKTRDFTKGTSTSELDISFSTSPCKAHFSRKGTSLHDSSIYWMFASRSDPSEKLLVRSVPGGILLLH